MSALNDGPFITSDQLEKWSTDTWWFQWANSRVYDQLKEVVDVAKLESYIASLRIQRDYPSFASRNISGRISEGWRDLNVSGPLFQEALWSVMQTWPTDWTPVEYLMTYAIDCKKNAPGQSDYDLGRAVRNLPSFLREYFIHSALFERGIAAVIPSPAENAQGHADLYISTDSGQVGLWSFQSTNKGFGMLKRKIQYRASSFSEINFLCPFDSATDSSDYFGWYLPSSGYLESLIQTLKRNEMEDIDGFRSWMAGGHRNGNFLMISAEEIQKFRI